ncbi:sterol desaturase family protein [Rhodocytophaga rosea]|uniref:Sterol desaturase family protein n=1 Tax=Rhodocytophaga rosea TaxID=2704465 RepID=A0A6C0GR75_9BACT|nr:sterol desaturase family protein [Rhodocytophaga rosea]QHT70595.1 sterol desaturase family protein [Rhodocytophaga rosea]
MKSALRIFDRVGAPLLTGLATAFFVMETIHDLRKRKQDRWQRLKTNSSIATVGLAGLRGALLPAMLSGSAWTVQKRFGLLQRLPLPRWLQGVLAFVLLDYSNYLWHRLNHQCPFLWRFHNVHHTDLDLDISTAWRFHAGEVLLSIFFRGGMIVLIGASPRQVITYEILYEGATAFHHSNWKLPFAIEKVLNKLMVTPRMHGIHHSIVLRETNSNYSVIFSAWDRLHGTVRLNVPQQEIVIGVPAYRSTAEENVRFLLILPFRPQREWKLPDGSIPERNASGNLTQLL